MVCDPALGAQVTRPVTGFEVNVGWSGEFEVEVDDVLIDFLARDKARVPPATLAPPLDLALAPTPTLTLPPAPAPAHHPQPQPHA